LKKLLMVAALLAALVSVGRASASPLTYGVADDWPKFHPCGDVWWQSAKDIGFQELRMTVQWDASNPTTIPYQTFIQNAVVCAQLSNITPVLAIYPAKPSAIGSNDAAQQQFAAFVRLVGTTFLGVKNFIVGNEPNVNRFWQPQYTNGQDAAAKDYEHTLAYSYDQLKSVRPDSIVWGPAISSRGNDQANATSNPSHSPVWFIADMAAAYKASGRTKPLFDVFNMHPYPPIQDTDPFTKPFQWPQAGAANLDRIKQALWDGFNGTAQQTPAEQPGGGTAQSVRFGGQGLPIALDEVGEQTIVPQAHAGAYTDPPENVKAIDEATQAQHYTDLAELAACDPDVTALLYFPLIDDTGLSDGFQSGELYADQAPKQSYNALKQKFATAKGQCSGTSAAWVHTTQVIGAAPFWAGSDSDSSTQPSAKTAGVSSIQISVTANEDATYTASLVSTSGQTVGSAVTGTVLAYHKPAITFTGPFANGFYKMQIVLKAVTNPSRATTLVSNVFVIGTAGASGGAGGTGSGGGLTVTGNLSTVSDADPQTLSNLYVSYFNKPADTNTLSSFVTQLGNALGTATNDMTLTASFSSSRSTSSAAAGPLTKSVRIKKGQKITLPAFGKIKAGTYRLRIVMKAAAGTVTITTPPFKVDAKGRLTSATAKAKPAPKPKPKKKAKKS
jgi:hypothetical protein